MLAWRAQSPSTSAPNGPKLSALREYADHVVPVADTHKRQYNEFERSERPLGEVLDLWESGQGKGLYVKDWHLLYEVEQSDGSAEDIYVVPDPFRGVFTKLHGT